VFLIDQCKYSPVGLFTGIDTAVGKNCCSLRALMDGSCKCVCIHSYDLSVMEYILHFLYPAASKALKMDLLSQDKKFVFYRQPSMMTMSTVTMIDEDCYITMLRIGNFSLLSGYSTFIRFIVCLVIG